MAVRKSVHTGVAVGFGGCLAGGFRIAGTRGVVLDFVLIRGVVVVDWRVVVVGGSFYVGILLGCH